MYPTVFSSIELGKMPYNHCRFFLLKIILNRFFNDFCFYLYKELLLTLCSNAANKRTETWEV